MQFRVQMLILLSCFVAICYPELMFSAKTAKTLQKIINLHRKYLRRLRVHCRIICLTNYFKLYAEAAISRGTVEAKAESESRRAF